MAHHYVFAETLSSAGPRLRDLISRIGSLLIAVPGRSSARFSPRREGRVIGLVGVVIVLFIVAFTNP